MIKSSIPEVHSAIVINTVSGEKNQQETYQSIADYAQLKQIDIHKIIFQIGEDGKTQKNIYTFGKEKNSSYSYVPIKSDYTTNFYDYTKLLTEEVLGVYTLTEKSPARIVEDFYELGIQIEVERAQWLLYFAMGLLLSIGQLFCMLIFCFFLSLLFYKSSIRKKIGIIEMLGKSKKRLFLMDYMIDVSIFIAILILFWRIYPHLRFMYLWVLFVGGLSILLMQVFSSFIIHPWGTISTKINGHKPYKALLYINHFFKVVLLVFTVISSTILLTNMTNNKQLEQKLSHWNKIPDYYHLSFSNVTTKLRDFKKNQTSEEWKTQAQRINQEMLPLLKKSEKSGGIFLRDNELGHTSEKLNYIKNDDFWLTNHNAIHELNVKDVLGKPIHSLEDAYFYVLIPENKKKYTDLIIQMAEEEIAFYQNSFDYIEGNYYGELKVIYTLPDQLVFNYNFSFDENMFSYNPIIVTMSLPLIQPNIEIWVSDISGGTYLFRDADEVHQFIEENQFELDFYGLHSTKDKISQEIVNAQLEYYTSLVASILIFTSFMAIEVYINLIYAEMNKKKSFLEYICGKTLFQRHKTHYITMVGTSMVSLMGLLLWKKELWFIAIILLSFESIFLVLTTYIAEKKQLLEVIKND